MKFLALRWVPAILGGVAVFCLVAAFFVVTWPGTGKSWEQKREEQKRAELDDLEMISMVVHSPLIPLEKLRNLPLKSQVGFDTRDDLLDIVAVREKGLPANKFADELEQLLRKLRTTQGREETMAQVRKLRGQN